MMSESSSLGGLADGGLGLKNQVDLYAAVVALLNGLAASLTYFLSRASLEWMHGPWQTASKRRPA